MTENGLLSKLIKASTGELWLDSSLNPVTNYTTTWNKIVPDGWTVKYVGIDDQ